MDMATIADVARLAGVSRTAVSFAFNDPSRLSAETLQRVLQVADELGYYPNPIARSLINKRVGVLGLLIPQGTAMLFANPFFAELLGGIGQICDEHDFSLLLVPPVQGSLLRSLARAAVDGYITIGLEEHHPAMELLRRRKAPFVTLDGPALPQISAVNVDDFGGARQAAAHLIERGHREALVLGIRPAQGEITDGVAAYTGVSAARLAGYRAAFALAGLPLDEGRIRYCDSTRDGGRQALLDAWNGGARPGALLAMSDIIAVGAMDAASRLGLRVPDDLAIVGFDDIMDTQICHPALSTVHQPSEEKGCLAARLLIDRQGGGQRVEHHVLPATLIVRGSSGTQEG
jgi:DNA-binding LacI/PurR family transcriptional regulator